MRELKFRIWDKKTNQFTTGCENRSWDGVWDIPSLFFEALRDVQESEDYVLQQFTGLTDSKRNPIYEGDILSHGGKIGTVYYNADRAGFVLEWEYSSRQQNYVNLTCDVAYESVNAGNMFENKELLK